MTKKKKKTTLVANAKQHAVMRAVLERVYQELHEAQNANVHDGTQMEVDGRNPRIPIEIVPRNKSLGRQDLGGGIGFAKLRS